MSGTLAKILAIGGVFLTGYYLGGGCEYRGNRASGTNYENIAKQGDLEGKMKNLRINDNAKRKYETGT